MSLLKAKRSLTQLLIHPFGVIISIVLLVSFQNVAKAQSSDTQLWNAAIIDWNFTTNWLVELEIDYNKLLSEGPVWREIATQPSIEFYPNNSIDLFAGVYLTSTKQNDVEDTNEIRPLIGFRWNIIKPEKRVFLRSQVKYEHRFFRSVTKDKSDNVSRFRLRLDLFVPLTQKSYNNDKDLYALLWSEAFINFDNEINEKYQSTFRQYLGLGYRFSYRWRLELNYVFQESRDSIEDQSPDTLSNVVYIALKHYLSKKD
jgi:hypothetical protein